jgi:hypothetical protein
MQGDRIRARRQRREQKDDQNSKAFHDRTILISDRGNRTPR